MAKKNPYSPHPVDTSDVELSEESDAYETLKKDNMEQDSQIKPEGKKEVDAFEKELNQTIERLGKIKKIKLDSSVEDEYKTLIVDGFKGTKDKLENLSERIEEKCKDSGGSKTNAEELAKTIEKRRFIQSLLVSATFFLVLAVFSSCAFMLFRTAISTDKSQLLIPLLIGGVLVLLIMAIMIMVAGRHTKDMFSSGKES